MSIQVYEFINVKERAEALGCNIPIGISLLPRNFETAVSKDELLHESSVPTIRTLWRQSKIPETKIEKEGDRFPYIQENAFEWVGPIIFVSASMLSQNPNAISVALGVISNYLTDWFKGVSGERKLKLDVVIEKTPKKNYARIHYEGDETGLKDLAKVVQEVWNDER